MKIHPPKNALKFLRWFCREDYIEEIEGDLTEVFEKQYEQSPGKAKRKFIWSVLKYFRPEFIKSFKSSYHANPITMVRHNFLITYRNFLRYKSSFFINLMGLSSGLTCVLLIYLWVNDELSVDKFHQKDDRLYQVMNNLESSKNILTLDITPALLADALSEEMPEIEYAVAVNDFFNWQTREGIFSVKDRHIQAKGWHAGKDFFNVFSYDLIHGDKDHVLTNKNSVVISEALAKKLFGTADHVIGKMLEWKHPFFSSMFQVSGIFKSPPANATGQFDFLISIEVLLDNDRWAKYWTSNTAVTYLVLKTGTDLEQFNEKIDDFLKSKDALNDNFTLFAQQYSTKYLYGHYENGVPAGGRIAYVKLFSIVAFFILVIACINFMNLSTAKASIRMKEIGVKKTIGVRHSELVVQFLSESLLTTFLSLLVALLLVVLLLPQFNEFTGKHLHLTFETADILAIAVIVLVTGLFSGSYPAFYLSGFKPLAVITGKLKPSTGALFVRKGLVIFQFTLSVIFIVGLLVVNEQIKFTQTKNMGYDRDNILCFQWKGELYNQWNGLLDGKSNERFETFMSGLKNIPGVVNATNMSGNILNEIYGQSGISWSGQEGDRNYIFQSPVVGYDFIETLGIELKAGRSFSREFNDDYSTIIINEAAVKLMEIKDPVGHNIQMNAGSKIIGVVKNFHYGSLHNAVEPLIFRFDPTGRNVMIKIKAGTEQNTIEQLKKFHREFLPGYAFEFRFMDDDYQRLYESENKVAVLSRYFSVIATIISCLGLFGLASFTAQRRHHEIGIRKILGANEVDIVRMLTGEFTRPVLLAIVVSLPISWLIVRSWLNSFEDRIDLSWLFFAGPGLLALFITWLTVGLQTLQAARVNPTECLRNE